MAFDPYAPAPPELETGPITTNPVDLRKLALGGAAAVVAPAMLPALALGSMAAGGVGPKSFLADPAAANAPMPVAPPPPLPAGLPPAAPPPMAAPAPSLQMPARTAGRGGGGARPTAPQVDAMGNEIKSAGNLAEQGAEELQGAKAAGAEEKAGLMGGMADLQEAQADERKATAERNSQLSQHLEEQDAANLKTARDKTIPDFWAGHKGAEVGSIISMALGGIASGILGGPNGAAQIIQKKTDDYFYREKEKIDNLYKYAEQTGKLNDKTRLRYAQELSDLGAQHLAVNQSILTRINQVEAKNQGAVDRAMITGLKANIEQATSKQLQDYRTTQQELANHTLTAKANAAQSYAAAGASRAAAQASREKATGTEDKTAVFDDSGKLLGHVTGGKGGAQAFSSRDADYTRALDKLTAFEKDISAHGQRALTPDEVKRRNTLYNDAIIGVATVSPLGKTNEAMEKEAGSIGASGAYTLTGANPEAIVRKRQEILDQRERFRAQGLLGYGGMRNEAAAAPQAGGQPPVGTRATSGGKPIVMTANGWQFAQ